MVIHGMPVGQGVAGIAGALDWRHHHRGMSQLGHRRHHARPSISADGDIALTVALIEYENAREFLILGSDHLSARFNYFMVLTSAALAGGGALAVSGAVPSELQAAVVVVVSFLVLATGGLTFFRIARWDLSRLDYLATINLLRGYLVSRAPEIEQFLVIPVRRHGLPWNWTVQSPLLNLAATVAVVDAIAAGALAYGVGAVAGAGGAVRTWVGGSALVAAALGHLLWQRWTAHRGYKALATELEARARLAPDSHPSIK